MTSKTSTYICFKMSYSYTYFYTLSTRGGVLKSTDPSRAQFAACLKCTEQVLYKFPFPVGGASKFWASSSRFFYQSWPSSQSSASTNCNWRTYVCTNEILRPNRNLRQIHESDLPRSRICISIIKSNRRRRFEIVLVYLILSIYCYCKCDLHKVIK